ncbi:GPI-anchored surface protein, putative [Bodo saltans]|uniref:Alpha-1,3-glucosyltransferase n=1 Tax=Bodo saltans TaxID=75058 RepID=A0A0S4KMI3_BODSA|nr:GPI-anchored surface protein, putative [Bodo saltans]|eukprot:CUI14081.1 GPI-anchored surface protein, putative [Bodo saltans]
MSAVSFREAMVLALILMVSLLLRWWVAMSSPHSGYKAPPMHGDFEAQRHWIELTTHLPLSDWYVQGPSNNLTYWGLDYPPLTAYHSMALGYFAKYVRLSDADFSSAFGLLTSRGSETTATIRFMRESVILSELLVFVPAALAVTFFFAVELDPLQWGERKREKKSEGDNEAAASQRATPFQFASRKRSPLLACFTILLNGSLPALIVDHAHFQYNCVSLGLMLWALYHAGKHCALQERLAAIDAMDRRQATITNRRGGNQYQPRTVPALSALHHLMASIMCAALSMTFKQMSLYYALGLGGWYLGECVRYAVGRADEVDAVCSSAAHPPPTQQRAARRSGVLVAAFLRAVIVCAVVGISTFALVLAPFVATNTVGDVAQRVFPVGRGLYEDKVANVWCTISPILKLPAVAQRIVASNDSSPANEANVRQMTLWLCLASTILGSLPAIISAVRSRPYGPPKPKVNDNCPWQLDIDPWTATQRACMRSQKRVEQLLWTVLCSSLSFYLFSYQVHEKGILLPLLPACVLLALLSRRMLAVEQCPHLLNPIEEIKDIELRKIQQQRGLLWLFVSIAHFSLFQLAEKDKILPLFTVLQLILAFLALRRCSLGPDDASQVAAEHHSPYAVPSPARAFWCYRIVYHASSQLVMRVLLGVFIAEEFVRNRWLEGNERYPHLGILSRFAVCTAYFLWMLLVGSAHAARSP